MLRSRILGLLTCALLMGACSSADVHDYTADRGDMVFLSNPSPRMDEPMTLPFVQQSTGPLVVSMNFQRIVGEMAPVYAARLVFRSQGRDLTLHPTVTMRDVDGLLFDPLTTELAAERLTGRTSRGIRPTAVAGPASSAMGLAGLHDAARVIGFAGMLGGLASSGDNEDFQRDLQWVQTHALPDVIELTAGRARGGLVMFEAPRPMPLALTVVTEVGTFEFEIPPEN